METSNESQYSLILAFTLLCSLHYFTGAAIGVKARAGAGAAATPAAPAAAAAPAPAAAAAAAARATGQGTLSSFPLCTVHRGQPPASGL